MCKKMAHSEQLNIKVRSPFFRLAVGVFGCRCSWLSLHLSGCRVSWPWPGVVPLDRVLQAWPGVGLGLLSGLVYQLAGLGLWFGFPCLDSI